MKTIVQRIEAELARLEWLCTTDNPFAFCVVAEEWLPRGWVRIYDDYTSGCYAAEDVLERLQHVAPDAEYGTELVDEGEPDRVAAWPESLVATEQLEDGAVSDNPNTLITLHTNAGVRYVAGPHGVSCDALWDTVHYGGWDNLCDTREAAIEQGCEASD